VELLGAYDFEEKMQSLEEYQVIDVRNSEEYKKGHIKFALNLEYNESSIAELLETLDKDKPVFVYCKTGANSMKAAAKMIEMGFQTVYELQGGITAWTNAGKPLVSVKSKTAQDKFTSGQLKKIINSEKVVLVDFYATWCIPCRKMDPAIAKLSKEFEGKALIARVNVENAKALAKELGIREIPVVNAYLSGKLVSYYVGYQSESHLRTIIKNLIKEATKDESKEKG
jgi:thioredoxin